MGKNCWMLLLTLSSLSLIAQISTQAKKTAVQRTPIPSSNVQFDDGIPLSGINASPVMTDPIKCSPDGVAFLDFLQPPMFQLHAVYSVSPSKKITKFSLGQIPGISDMTLNGYYPGNYKVAFLLLAKKHDMVALPHSDAKEDSPRDLQYFIALFDRDGKYDKLLSLNLPFRPMQVALFDSGKIVVLGHDEINDLSKIAFLDTDGSLMRYLDPTSTIAADKTISKSFGGTNGSALIEALGTAQFVPFEEAILLVSRGSRLPIEIIRESGIARQVELDLPDDEVISTFIPSTSRNWYVRSMIPRGSQGLPKSLAVYQIDPQTGMRTRDYSIGVFIPAIGCETDGSFSAFLYDNKKNQIQLRIGEE